MINYVALDEVAEINPKPPKLVDEAQEVSFIPMAAVSENGFVAFEENRLLKDVRKGFTCFKRGDFLIAKITPCFENGKAALTCNIKNEIGYGSTEFHVVRPDDGKLDKRYLYYLLWSNQFRFFGRKEMRGAAGQKRITTDFLKGYKIPLPPLEEQKRIAAILDKADALRRKRQQAIDLTDQLLRSVFLDMFGDPVTNSKGWKQVKMGAVLDVITYGLTVRPKYVEKGYRLISAREIRDGYVAFGNAPFISEQDFEALSEKGKPQKGEILFSKTGSIGHCAIVDTDYAFSITQNAARLKFNEEILLNEFCLYYLRTDSFQNIAKSRAKGNAVKDLQLGDMKEFLIYCPPLTEQEMFINIVKKQKRIITKLSSASELSRLNFDALAQLSFKGELTKQTEAA